MVVTLILVFSALALLLALACAPSCFAGRSRRAAVSSPSPTR
ncbi:hypothetical protein [Aquisphaera giovannonii]|nr:hypothetical protein [Aquisphaera giovannonii]